MLHIVPHGGGRVADLAQAVAGGEGEAVLLDEGLDLVLQVVRQLEALAAENFDAVEGVGVVAGADHHARVRLVLHHKVGHGGGGHHAQVDDVRPHAAQARRQRRAQHVAGDAGVLAQHHQGAATPPVGEHGGRRAADVHGKLTSHILAGNAAHAVGAE